MSFYCIPPSGSNPTLVSALILAQVCCFSRNRHRYVLYPLLGGRDLRGTKNAPKNVELYNFADGHSYSQNLLTASDSTAKLRPNFHEGMSKNILRFLSTC